MPTRARFGSISLRMFADDHNPPHFHLKAPDFDVSVRIADFVVIEGKVARAKLLEPIAWAEQNRAMLQAKWSELNERG